MSSSKAQVFQTPVEVNQEIEEFCFSLHLRANVANFGIRVLKVHVFQIDQRAATNFMA